MERKLEAAQESIGDHQQTILKFRDLVAKLQVRPVFITNKELLDVNNVVDSGKLNNDDNCGNEKVKKEEEKADYGPLSLDKQESSNNLNY